jgi:hypothetical protein
MIMESLGNRDLRTLSARNFRTGLKFYRAELLQNPCRLFIPMLRMTRATAAAPGTDLLRLLAHSSAPVLGYAPQPSLG